MPSGAIAFLLAASDVDAAHKPKYDHDDQYQAENAAESCPAVPVITMVAAESAERQDYQYNN